DGFAVRVPTTTVSLLDLTVNLRDVVNEEKIEKAMREAAAGDLRGILAVSDEPVVSSDFRGSEYSAVVDLPLTQVIGGTMARVVAWYDNEMAYSTRVVDLISHVASRGV
ncbi:MAG: type I glyceraldehyde-3-phosphate dehydrogenase, partial [Bacillota bacterium]